MPSNVPSSESVIQKLEDDLIEAMILPNLIFLENTFSEKYVSLFSDGSTGGKEKALNDFKHPNYKLSKIEVLNRQITMHDNTAIVTGIVIVDAVVDDKSVSGKSFFTRVWHKEEDIWRIIAVQTNLAKSK
jgi:hypothetical protein